VHRVSETLPDHGTAYEVLPDEGPRGADRGSIETEAVQQPRRGSVHPASDHHQVVAALDAVSGVERWQAVLAIDPLDPPPYHVRSPPLRLAEQKGVEARVWRALGTERPQPTVHRGDPLLAHRRADADLPHVGMQHVGVDATLDHRRRQRDPLGSQVLDQRLRDDPAAHIAAARAAEAEVPVLEDVHRETEPHARRHVESEDAEEGAGRAAADYPDARAVLQLAAATPPTRRRASPHNLALHRLALRSVYYLQPYRTETAMSSRSQR
jgi:hypothetical protein